MNLVGICLKELNHVIHSGRQLRPRFWVAMTAKETSKVFIPTGSLPGPVSTQPSASKRSTTVTLILITALGLLVNYGRQYNWELYAGSHDSVHTNHTFTNVCPQVPELIPKRNFDTWESLGATYDTEAFKSKAVDWLSKAVRIPTESYDYYGPVGTDPRWEKFHAFHAYLQQAFPLVHATLELTKVNTYGLIFVWKGSDTELKPLLLTGHQDVVPVEPATIDDWIHPPFSGHFDGTFVWGRGSCDDKSGITGIMAAVETMLAGGYEPTRSVVLAFGFDEESRGTHGARMLAVKLEEMFGTNGYAMLVDEGSGYAKQYGRNIATPSIAEKGYLDIHIEVTTPGGHSSLPPPHTSIGILAQMLVKLEANPFKARLAHNSPAYKSVQCLAAHAPDLPEHLRRDILESAHSDEALQAAENALFSDLTFKSLVGTTQAIDIVQGGVKVNALPEQAWALVNHRISTESSITQIKASDIELLKPLASKFNLAYSAFGESISYDNHFANTSAYGNLTLSEAFGKAGFEPAPVTPTEGDDAAPYKILSGSIKAAFNKHRGIEGDDGAIVVSPGVMSGSTDTAYYWRLTPHIIRYGHIMKGSSFCVIHTANEAMLVDNFMEIIRYYTALMLNVDESALP
ncbi:hypothetical protein EDC04DRAFT_1140559 [Pisolithus marmoratus]|nr:hypothetical protein EDC04DRAFT_1140559 [Pisolithus marmoratus]